MSNRERTLIKLLIFIIFAVPLILTFNSFRSTIRESKDNITKYEKMIAQIKKENSKNTLDKKNVKPIPIDSVPPIQELTTSEITDLILENLKNNGIIPQKYQLSSSAKGESLELSIICSGKQIISYLCSLNGKIQPFNISNITIKNNTDYVTVSIRYLYKKTNFLKNSDSITISTLSKLLRPVLKPVVNSSPVNAIKEPTIEEKTEIIEDGNKIFKIIGNITENENISFLYLKNINTSRIYKIHPNDILENNTGKYIVIIDDKKYFIDK